MKIGYFQCFSGASGDMILGALLDAGLPLDYLREGLKKLNLSGYELNAFKIRKGFISGTDVKVEVAERHGPTGLEEILRIIKDSSLHPWVKEKGEEIFTKLAQAEARIHDSSLAKVHFHEVGAVDSIVDVMGSVIGIFKLGLEEIYCSPINIGTGFVKTCHGLLPVPVPATLELLKGVPTYCTGIEAETLTPTGAAILTTLSRGFGKMPSMLIEQVGYGAGDQDFPIPNLLRLVIGEKCEEQASELSTSLKTGDSIVLVETNIDDMNPQFYEPIMEGLYKIGALEVYLTPVMMKRSRPATLISALTRKDLLWEVSSFLLKQTTTLGIRWKEMERITLEREEVEIGTKYGPIKGKKAKHMDGSIKISPEFEDCRRLAETCGVPLKEIYQEALKAAKE